MWTPVTQKDLNLTPLAGELESFEQKLRSARPDDVIECLVMAAKQSNIKFEAAKTILAPILNAPVQVNNQTRQRTRGVTSSSIRNLEVLPNLAKTNANPSLPGNKI